MINKGFNIKALLAIINSKLISFYNLNTSANAFKGSFPKVLLKDLRDLPIPELEESDSSTLEQFCDQLLTLHKQIHLTKLQSSKEQIQNQIDYIDRKINETVYRLYGLTKEEIKNVEAE